MTIQQIYSYFEKSSGVSIDSRTVFKNQLFIAIKGDNFDGNKYALNAIEKGAIAAIVSDPNIKGENVILVEDGLECLQDLASYFRAKFDFPIIAITGSNGKTTTKELIQSVLSTELKGKATFGNLNNHIGVPLTLLSFSLDQDYGIVEMGANHLGEIESYCKIAKPEIGIITNIGKAHMGTFGSFNNIIKGKSELFEYLIQNDGLICFLEEEKSLEKYLTFSENRIPINVPFPKSSRIVFNQHTPFIKGSIVNESKSHPFNSPLMGVYNTANITFGFVMGDYFKIEPKNITKGISNYLPNNNRSQWINTSNNNLLLDAYNANPSSMELAIDYFINEEFDNKVLILGDMNELGIYGQEEHKKVINLVNKYKNKVERCFFVGPQFGALKKENTFIDVSSLITYLKEAPLKGFNILIKGSRSIQLEKLVDTL